MLPGVVRTKNPEISQNVVTYLSSAAASAATTLTVTNTAGFAASDYVVLGNMGEEKAELVKITTVDSDTQFTVPAIDFAHPIDAPVRVIGVNQVKVYRSTTETGTFSLLATIAITVDSFSTGYTDSGWTTDKWYKTSYYNATTTLESSLSDAIQATGYKEGSCGHLIKIIRRKLKTSVVEEEFVTDEELMDLLNEGEKECEGFYQYQETSTTANTVASQQDYSFPANYKNGGLRTVRVTVGANFYYPEYIPRSKWEMYNTTTITSTIPTQFTIFEGKYSFYPIPSANGTNNIKLWYYKKLGSTFADYNDTSTVPDYMVLVNYCMKEILADLGDPKMVLYEKRYGESRIEMLKNNASKQRKEFSAVRDKGKELSIDPNRWSEITEA